MGRPRILPDADVLGTLIREGKTYDEIAHQYGVTKAAVHVALTRSNLIRNPRPRYDDEIPWHVKTEHANAYPLAMLRLEARRLRGKKIAPDKLRYLENWKARLERSNAVVGYHPDLPDGFYYTDARPGIDTGLIRVPLES
jgi:hypothetical protein